MYVEECLARARHQEHLSKAEEERSAQQVAELRKVERRQQRAERALLQAWQVAEQVRSTLHAS
jgi:hypothetical protein